MELITLPKPAPDEDCIAMLEDWLARAKSGENIAIAIAGVDAEGGYDTSFFGGPQKLLGVVAYLQYRMCCRIGI